MKRRSFIKLNSILSAPLFLKGFPVFAAPSTGNNVLDILAESTIACGKILVIIQQNGGNDGLNTFLPLDKWSNLSNARSNILMNQSSVLTLTNNATTGLHPAMSEIQNLYNDGKIMLVQGVSYPNPNFSHFRATDIWFTAADSNVNLSSGWLGRALDIQYPNFPNGYPNATMPDPLAIQIGSTLPFSLQGPNINMGYNAPDPSTLLNVINGITDPAPNNDYGTELTFLRLMKDQSNAYRSAIQNAYNVTQSQTATYPSNNSLADQLKIVAKLINGGLTTPIYIVNHPKTHDTHDYQVDINDKTLGAQATNLSLLSQAIGAFQTDLGLMGKQDIVTGMTFSEFGRRIKSNGSYGTDHGSSAPIMFFGAALNTNPAAVTGTSYPVPGMIGSSPNLPTSASVSDQVPMQFDFRQIYSTVMQDWLCMSQAEATAVLGSNFSRLPVFKNSTLPIDDIILTGQYYGGEANLNYLVPENSQYESFALQYSTNGIIFKEINNQINVSLNQTENYYFKYYIDSNKMYFRIAAKKHQGEIKYSNVLLLRNSVKQLISIFPNPVINDTINIKLFEQVNTYVDVTIFNILGAKVYYNRFNSVGTTLTFKVPELTKHVHYIVEVTYDTTTVHEEILFL